MKMLHLSSAILLAIGFSAASFAQTTQTCPDGTQACTISNQTIGDTDNSVDHSTSESNQLNPSSNSNASGVDISADQRLQQSGNTVDQHGSTQSATGGDSRATGNLSTNDNHSSVGDTSSYSGGNTLAGYTGDNTNTNKSGDVTGKNTSTNTNDTVSNAAGGSVKGNSFAGGNSDQSQGQKQGISQSGNSANKNRNNMDDSGNSTSYSLSDSNSYSGVGSSGNSANKNNANNSGGNSSVSVDTSDHSSHNYSENIQFIPPVVPQTPPTALPAAQVSTIVGACQPISEITRQKVEGRYMGFFHTKSIDLGYTDSLQPGQGYYERVLLPNGDTALYGVQPVIQTAVVSVAAGRNLALGGGSGSGNWGQAGGGNTSAMQQMVTHITLMRCEAGILHHKATPVIAPVVTPAPRVHHRKRIKRKVKEPKTGATCKRVVVCE